MSDVTLTDDAGPQDIAIQFLDAKGNQATPGATPEWSSSDESVGTLDVADDGMSAVFTPSGEVGATQLVALDPESEVDDTDDVNVVGTISVVSGKAVSGEMTITPQA